MELVPERYVEEIVEFIKKAKKKKKAVPVGAFYGWLSILCHVYFCVFVGVCMVPVSILYVGLFDEATKAQLNVLHKKLWAKLGANGIQCTQDMRPFIKRELDKVNSLEFVLRYSLDGTTVTGRSHFFSRQ